ncbi:MAG: PEGA domain-containing protein [Myxococcota bacterium]
MRTHIIPLPINLPMVQRLALVACVWLVGLAVATPAIAQDDEPKVDAFALMQEATADAQKRRYGKAIEKFTQVAQADPAQYPNAYYNLGELLRFKKRCIKASLAYARFLELSPDVPDRQTIEKHITTCRKGFARPGKATIRVTGPESPVISIDGLPISTSPDVTVELPAGKYRLKVNAPDYKTFVGAIEVLEGDNRDLNVSLKAKTYYGTLELKVNVEGAQVSIDGGNIGTTPLKEPVQLKAGKHFLELTKEGYHRWIRNVHINRDDAQVVDITMQTNDKP